MTWLDNAEGHFRTGVLEAPLLSADVRGFGLDPDEPSTVFFHSEMTLAAKQSIIDARDKGGNLRMMAQSLIVQALDENGRRRFPESDACERLLSKVAASVIEEAVVAIDDARHASAPVQTVDEAAGN